MDGNAGSFVPPAGARKGRPYTKKNKKGLSATVKV